MTPTESNKPSKVDVFGFGHCCIDYLSILDPYPLKGKKGDVVKSLVIGGGPVPTALQTVVKLGGSARFCGKVGADWEGRQVITELRAAGVDVEPMVIDPDVTTARAFIWIDPYEGSRTVALDISRFTWVPEDQLDEKHVRECRVFITDCRATEAALKALRIAHEAKITTILDAGSVRPRFEEILPLIDYAIVSRDMAETFTALSDDNRTNGGIDDPSELARKLVNNGAGTGIVTKGEMGAVSCDGDKVIVHPGYKVDVYDTTGAGDVFHGAFIYGLLQNWSLRENIRFANAAAALSCRKLSGSMGIPSKEEVFNLIQP